MTDGAFVELDTYKLDRDELVLLGMKEAHDAWLNELRSQAGLADNPIVVQILETIAEKVAERRDTLAVILTRSAMRHKSGTLHNMKAEV